MPILSSVKCKYWYLFCFCCCFFASMWYNSMILIIRTLVLAKHSRTSVGDVIKISKLFYTIQKEGKYFIWAILSSKTRDHVQLQNSTNILDSHEITNGQACIRKWSRRNDNAFLSSPSVIQRLSVIVGMSHRNINNLLEIGIVHDTHRLERNRYEMNY